MHMKSSALVPLDEALARLLAHIEPLRAYEDVPLLQADGRILATEVIAQLNQPPWDNSAMDGYAVRVADCAQAPVALPVSQRIAAGQTGPALQAGSAARIFTGAPLPAGADAVVMQEETQAVEGDADSVRILSRPKTGQNIRRKGEDVRCGQQVLKPGIRLTPAAIGLAAGIGVAALSVVRQPRVALLATGDELVDPGQVRPEDLPAGHIYNSNRYFLHALLHRLGCVVTDIGRVADNLEATQQALQHAAQGHDLIVSTGGVSVGEEDYVKAAVQALGQLDLWQVAIKPGKPFAFGRLQASGPSSTYFVGLPGNPVSSFVTFLVLLRPLILKLQGVEDVSMPARQLPAAFSLQKPGWRREFLRARVNARGELELFPNQGSGVLTSMHWAHGLIDLAAGQQVQAGDLLPYIALGEWMT